MGWIRKLFYLIQIHVRGFDNIVGNFEALLLRKYDVGHPNLLAGERGIFAKG